MNKIALSGLAYQKQGAGISQYTKALVDEFLNQDVDLLLRNEHQETYGKYRNVRCVPTNIRSSKKRILYEQLIGIPTYNKYSLVHFTDYATCIMSRTKSIITVHDMAMYTMEDMYTKAQIAIKSSLLKASLHKVSGIICDSEYAKKELLTYFPQIGDKVPIEVIYLGIKEQTHSLVLENTTLKNKPYILNVGTIAPSKNITSLIKAFNIMKDTYKDLQLVLVGNKGWMFEQVEKEYQESKYKDDIIFTGFVTEEQLEYLYQNCEAFVTPSLYEGFGFTPLEAMKRGVATAVSDIDIFKETCAECACYFDPHSPESIADEVLKVIDDNELNQRLKIKGNERANQFTWKRTAAQTHQFYLKVLESW